MHMARHPWQLAAYLFPAGFELNTFGDVVFQEDVFVLFKSDIWIKKKKWSPETVLDTYL